MQITLKDKELQRHLDAISNGEFSERLCEGKYSSCSIGIELHFGEPWNPKDHCLRYCAHLYFEEFEQSKEEILENQHYVWKKWCSHE
jgi:hypothetical protein